MDACYNIEEAARALEEITNERVGKTESKGHAQQLSALKFEGLEISQYSSPKTWRVSQADGPDEFHEAVVRFQGILCDKQLPPVSRIGGGESALSKQRRHIRQAVTLTGLGSPAFQRGIDNIAYLYMMILNQFPEAIDAYARYFTERRLAPQEPHLDYGFKVDPHGVLAEIQGHDFIHGADNYVEYLELKRNIEGQTQYVAANPVNFRIGDIVEVQLAFVGIPIKNDKIKMLVSLRGLTLLDNTHRNQATMTRMSQRIRNVQVKGLKRKTMYSEEDVVEETGSVLSRMKI